MNKVIEALKKNEFTVFLGWTFEMQKKANDIGIVNFKQLSNDVWLSLRENDVFSDHLAYRLRDTYEEDGGVEKEKVFTEDDLLRFTYNEHHHVVLAGAVTIPDFIGYLYEDGAISIESRLYVPKGRKQYTGCICADRLDDYEVLTPTHCLFRKAD